MNPIPTADTITCNPLAVGDVVAAKADDLDYLTKGNDYIVDAIDGNTLVVHTNHGKPKPYPVSAFDMKPSTPGEPTKRARPMRATAPRVCVGR